MNSWYISIEAQIFIAYIDVEPTSTTTARMNGPAHGGETEAFTPHRCGNYNKGFRNQDIVQCLCSYMEKISIL